MQADSLSSTAKIDQRHEYDVFLSFRGEDTRDHFTSHLNSALCRKKIRTFMDSRLERGDEISRALVKAIESSRLSVIVFSENYADSSWCLEELVSILGCKEEKGQFVIPVFYGVDPSDVRKQLGSYAAAFARLEERYGSDRMEKLEEWRSALTSAANLSGRDSFAIRPESKLVDVIVEDILKKLNSSASIVGCKGLVGIETRIERIETLLCIGAQDVRIVGIWGMGGIGKTTLATVLYIRHSCEFEGSCFLSNIRAESEKNGLNHLQSKLFSDLMEEEIIMCGLGTGSTFLFDRLRRKKVLIVLDDVNNVEQLDWLVGGREWFGTGTRIIITSRDVQVLHSIENDGIYNVKALNRDEARQLFHLNVFKENHVAPVATELLERVVSYAKGIPLALKVLGSLLRGKSKDGWESALNKLKVVPSIQIQNVLKVSYDALDDLEKDIFLDIAFFFIGTNRDLVERVLDGCGFFAKTGISVLIDRSLLTMIGKKLWMQDLLEEMGLEIVRQQSMKEPGKRSRLRIAEDICHVFTNNTGTASVEGILLDISKIKRLIHASPEVFVKMYNLRVLKIYNSMNTNNLHFPQGLKSLPCALRYLHWEGYPMKSLPLDFNPQNLVELRMPHNLLEQLWTGVQNLELLKRIDLRDSKYLIQIPDLTKALNVEIINLESCTSLAQVSSNLQHLDQLRTLCLNGCSSLERFPELPGNIKYLYLGGTTIKQVPSSIGCLSSLEVFHLTNCKSLESLPTDISRLKSLGHLSLSGCSNLESFPEIIKPMECLRYLFLDRTKIKEIPSSIKNMIVLEILNLKMCKSLEIIPSSIYELDSLQNLILSGCFKLENLPCPALDLCPSPLPNLKHLDISNCKILKSLPGLPASLVYFDAHNCISLETMTSTPRNLSTQGRRDTRFFEDFSFSNCSKLDQKARNNILADSQLRMLWMALVCSKPIKVSLFTPDSAHHTICYPENKIPEWFNNQSDGSSITVKLPPHWYNKSFLGFALSVIASFDNHCHDPYFSFQYECHFKTSNGESHKAFGCCSNNLARKTKLLNFNHLFLWYEHKNYHNCHEAKEVSFYFNPASISKRSVESCKVQRCGIRLLYVPDAIKESSLINQALQDLDVSKSVRYINDDLSL